MKSLRSILFFAVIAFFTMQNAVAQETGQSADEKERLENTSLFQEYVSSGNYADALKPWEIVYEKWPASTAYIYAYGSRILAWQISQTTDETEKKALIDKLMKLYDDRITYFGTNAKQPKPWILGMKALDYITYHPKDALKKDAYGWLDEAITGLGDRSELAFIQHFIYLSSNIYLNDPTHAEKFIQDYLKANEILESKMKELPDGDKQKEYAKAVKQANDQIFVQTGAATCEMLETIYGKDLEANKDNTEWLNNTIGFFKKLKCTESPTYFAASVYLHNIAPTSESANGVGEMSYLKKDYNKAIEYFEQAASLATNNEDKGEYQYKIAQVYTLHLRNYPKGREFARLAITNKPNWGTPYLLIARMYADTKGIYNDEILSKSVYWAAAEMCERAKQVDPSIASDANKYISSYKAHFPTKEEIFFKPELELGQSFTVGGWINERVTCRSKD